MWLRQPGLIFRVLLQHDSATIRGIALARHCNGAPAPEFSGDVAVGWHEYEITVWRSSLDPDCRLVAGGWRHDLRAGFRLAARSRGQGQAHHFPDRAIPTRQP